MTALCENHSSIFVKKYIYPCVMFQVSNILELSLATMDIIELYLHFLQKLVIFFHQLLSNPYFPH